MDSHEEIDTRSKRLASEMEQETDSSNSSKKRKSSSAACSDSAEEAENEGQHRPSWAEGLDVYKPMADVAIGLNKLVDTPLPSEREGITSDLEAGSHTLVLEHNNVTNAKCRASKCLVEGLRRHHDDKIRSPYRLNLQAIHPSDAHWTVLEKPNRRFYHVSCFEAIGVDIATYLNLPRERTVTHAGPSVFGFSYNTFHPAIVDWVTNKGKAFDAMLYGSYEEELGIYNRRVDHLLTMHLRSCSKEKCTCGLPLDRPMTGDFIQGEPPKRSLTDVLLHVLGAEDLLPLPHQIRIQLLENPRGVITRALAILKADLAAKEEKKTADDGDDAEMVDGIDIEDEKVAGVGNGVED